MSDLFDYKKEMIELRFSENQKKILAATAASAAQGTGAKRRRPVFRTALIAAAMAAALVVGSSAAGILPSPAEIFAPLFGGSVAQTEVIDKIGRPIGASDTDGGITITAEAISGFKNTSRYWGRRGMTRAMRTRSMARHRLKHRMLPTGAP